MEFIKHYFKKHILDLKSAVLTYQDAPQSLRGRAGPPGAGQGGAGQAGPCAASPPAGRAGVDTGVRQGWGGAACEEARGA